MRCWAGVSVCAWLVVSGCGTGAPEGGTETLTVEPDAIRPFLQRSSSLLFGTWRWTRSPCGCWTAPHPS